jgi:hypothetical protein
MWLRHKNPSNTTHGIGTRMKMIDKLKAGSFRFQVFAQGFLGFVYDEDECLLRDAQQAGNEALAEKDLMVMPPTVTSYSRQIRDLGFAVMSKKGRRYYLELTDNQDLLDAIEEFLQLELELGGEKADISDLKFPRVVTQDKPLPLNEYRRYTKAVLNGQAKMIFKLVNND